MKETKLKFKIAGISVDEKSLDWTVKIKNLDCLSAVRNSYAMSIVIDEDYFADRIVGLKDHIARVEKEPDLFDNAKNEIAKRKTLIPDYGESIYSPIKNSIGNTPRFPCPRLFSVRVWES